MRIQFIVGIGCIGSFAVGMALAACGGTSTSADSKDASSNAPIGDSSTDAADSVDAAPTCDPNNDFLANIPAGPIGDAGATSEACVACTKSKCTAQVSACAADCPCQTIGSDVLKCYFESGSIPACASSLISVPKETQTVGLGLFSCLQKSCQLECVGKPASDAGDAGDGG